MLHGELCHLFLININHNKTLFQALSGYGVPPVVVDSTPHPHEAHRKSGLKSGYFPPETRDMPRVSRKSKYFCMEPNLNILLSQVMSISFY